MVVDRSNVDHITRGLQSTEGVRLHNHRKKLRQRFDIIKKLGQGTYGKVQLGINKETGQEVAIKTIKKCKIETEADLVRIRREIQIMSSVRHPNIIHIYEVFENREKIVLVMEYAAGGELYDYLSERKVLEETEARRIFRQISTAIYYCHKHKICHRDLKLENILLDEHGSAKIADFGLSNVFDGTRLLSTYCGSPLYASPEIVKGTPYHGPEVDCWSLGVLLYTLVYGAMPFDGTNFKRLVKHISQGDYFEPKKASPASPLIRDMLTVNSPDRATIEQICSHWWVNQGFNVSCLDIAEDLANQTPVRLDLLLSLAPPPENTEKIVVTDEQRDLPQEGPPRSMSVGSFMDLDGGNAEERVRSFVAREVPSEQPNNEKTMKRKLEPVPSKSFSGARKKERTKPETEEEEVVVMDKEEKPEPIVNETDESAKQMDKNNTVMDVDTETVKPVEPTKKESVKDSRGDIVEKKSDAESEKVEEKGEIKRKEPEKAETETIAKDKPTRKSVKVVKKKVVDKKDSETKGVKDPEPVTDEKAKVKKKKTESTAPGSEQHAEVKKKDKSVEGSPAKEEPKEKSSESPEKSIKKEDGEKEKGSRSEGGTIKAPTERRKSKIFETAEKFMGSDQKSPTQEKPKKVYIPGVKVSDFAKAFERRSSIPTPTPPLKSSPSKKTVSKESSPVDRKTLPAKSPEKKSESPEIKKGEDEKSGKNQTVSTNEKEEKESPEKKPNDEIQPVPINDEKLKKLKDSARNVIASALVEEERKKLKKQVLKPPVPRTKTEDLENRKKNLTLQIGKETATVQVHTPENTKFLFEPQNEGEVGENKENVAAEKPKEKKTSKVEITLKSNTLPRRTSKPEIPLTPSQMKKEPGNFRTEIEHRVGDPSHVYSTQRSEVAFPVSAAPKPIRSMSLEPEGRLKQSPVQKQPTRERIIPIEFEGRASKEETEARDRVKELDRTHEGRIKQHPYHRTWSLKSNSLSRQSTQDSDTESTVGSTTGEAIKKSPREFIIPIAVEGGGYVTPRATSLEPSESISSKRSHRPFSRKISLWSDNGSEDESPFSTLQRHSSRDFDEPFRLHRLRSSRPARPSAEKADSGSGSEEEEEDDDGFELLTAENLFSTLLSRVRSLTQRLNVEDGLRPGFPSSRFLSNHFGPSERLFSNFHQPMKRLSDRSDFGRSLSRDPENGESETGWNRGRSGSGGDSESSGRCHPKGGDSIAKRSDSDTESLSESLSHRFKGKSSEEKKGKKSSHHHHHHHHHHHQRHHSRTRSMPSCPAVSVEGGGGDGGREECEGSRQGRMWTGKAYERTSLERDLTPSIKYRTEIPKLMRPTSLLLERRRSSQDEEEKGSENWDPKSGETREKDFYDILAEKYGITNVKRYDLPRERRERRGYQSSNSRYSCIERRDERENSEEKENEGQFKKDETSSGEKYKAPSEKLAAVLNRLESRTERNENGNAGTDRKFKMEEEEGVKSRIPKKVTARHRSDLTLKEYNGLKEKERREEEKRRKEESPEKSIRNQCMRYHSLDEGNRSWRRSGEEDCRREMKPVKKYVDSAIRSLRENSVGPQDVSSENVLIKRAVSLSDCASCKTSPRGSRPHQSTVNSVVGMFNKLENNGEGIKRESDWEKQDGGAREKSKIPVSRKKTESGVPRIELPLGNKTETETSCHSFQARRFSSDHASTKANSSLNLEDPNNYLSPDSENFELWSLCSDLGNPDDVILRNHPSRQGNADDLSKESVSERIRRKSFYTRFNDWKKPRRSFLLSRSYEPDYEVEAGRGYQPETGGRPTYLRSVSTGDDPRPRPFYKAQVLDGQASSQKRDSYDWSRNRATSPSYLRSGSHSPSSYASLTLPRNFTLLDGGRNYRSMSVYSQRPFSPVRPRSPSLKGESPESCLE